MPQKSQEDLMRDILAHFQTNKEAVLYEPVNFKIPIKNVQHKLSTKKILESIHTKKNKQ
jgi:hypothetical protein